jgi:hypothetical protein
MRRALATTPLIFVALLSLALALASPAAAETAAPDPSLTDDYSAADQYVESVPTSRGPKVPGVGKRHEQRAELPPGVKDRLAGQPQQTAAKLEQIATSPDYGAPATVERERKQGSGSGSKSVPRVPVATVNASEGEQDTLLWLSISLLSITALAAGSAAYRHYQRRKSAG